MLWEDMPYSGRKENCFVPVFKPINNLPHTELQRSDNKSGVQKLPYVGMGGTGSLILSWLKSVWESLGS